MRLLPSVLVLSVLSFTAVAYGQSDQEVVSAVDSPDPVTPGAALSYTVTVRNNGPNAAVNGGLNINLPAAVTHTTDAMPAGWTCLWFGNNGTCVTPSFAAGTTEIITINTTVAASLAEFPDQSITANFFPSGTTPDPNNANNSKTPVTLVDSPQVDLSVTASDSPDPVFPDGNVTYAVTATNSGPDTASNVTFNVVPNSSLRFQSSTIPAGWSCTLPSVGAINATFTCSASTWAAGTDTFTVVFSANDETFGTGDTTFQTSFSVDAGGSNETDASDNLTTVTTAYTTPDADLTLSVVDSPDPVSPDGHITYTVTVGNTGPDDAPDVTLTSFGSNDLRFISATVPAGWNCTLPASNAQTAGFSCTRAGGLASGASDVLTFVLQATDELIGLEDTTIQFGFSAASSIADPDPSDNSETESTAYTAPDADLTVSVVDSPDPVSPDGHIIYTVTVGNTGPDAAPDVTLSSFGSNNLRFISATVPAGWNCTLPASNAQTAGFSCTRPGGLASGASDVLTFVLQATDELIGLEDTTIQFGFSAATSIADPDPSDNSETESTAYTAPDADLTLSVVDSPDPVSPDGHITYTVTVGNTGPDAAPDVTLTSFGSNDLRFISATIPAGWNCTLPASNAQTAGFSCTRAGALASGASDVLTFILQATDELIGLEDTTIQFGFSAATSIADPDPSDNSETESTAYATPEADLTVSGSDSPDPVAPEGDITYTVTVGNSGPDAAAATLNVPMNDTLEFTSISVPAGFSCTGIPTPGAASTFSCTNPAFASGENGVFLIVLNADASAFGNTDQSITQSFSVTGDVSDPNVANNAVDVATSYAAPDADLSVSKSTTTNSIRPGETFHYAVTVTNSGPDAAAAVVLTDVLPSPLLFRAVAAPAGWTCTTPAAGTNGTISCSIASLPNTASATFTLTVESNASSGSATNTVSAASATADPNNGNSSDSATPVTFEPPSADLSLTKHTGTTSTSTGEVLTYTITVSNAGPSPATNVVVTDTLPAGLELVSATPSEGTCGGTTTVTCNLGTILDGLSATIALQTRVVATSGTVANTATVVAVEDAAGDFDSTPPVPVEPAAAEIPTMSGWLLMIMGATLILAAMARIR